MLPVRQPSPSRGRGDWRCHAVTLEVPTCAATPKTAPTRERTLEAAFQEGSSRQKRRDSASSAKHRAQVDTWRSTTPVSSDSTRPSQYAASTSALGHSGGDAVPAVL